MHSKSVGFFYKEILIFLLQNANKTLYKLDLITKFLPALQSETLQYEHLFWLNFFIEN
jgi:hypothetical protein